MSTMKSQELVEAATKLAALRQSDVILYNGPVEFRGSFVISRAEPKSENLILILVTLGGSPHEGYRIARMLQKRYKKITVIVSGQCYSAGTLIALCANELVVGELGNLGPLDIQVAKMDEVFGEMSSGLTSSQAASVLSDISYQTFNKLLIDIKDKDKTPGFVTLKTAMTVATEITTGLLSEVYAQIDPMKVADDARAMDIMLLYGERLIRKARNTHEGALKRLVHEYPAHDCLIDLDEATELFTNVRPPSIEELEVLDVLQFRGLFAHDKPEHLMVNFWSPQSTEEGTVEASHEAAERGTEGAADERADSDAETEASNTHLNGEMPSAPVVVGRR